MHITFLFYDGMTALDAIGPHEVLSRLPYVTVQRVSIEPGIINAYLGLKLIADCSLAEVTKTDVLVIPGGGNATTLQDHPEILEWIRDIHKTSIWTTSVCTGSLILGAAGLLTGQKATSHWAVIDRLGSWGAIPTDQRVVESGKIITAAGVSAGIDMALLLSAKLAGEDFAKELQLGIEYDPEPPFDSGSIKKASPQVINSYMKHLKDRFNQN